MRQGPRRHQGILPLALGLVLLWACATRPPAGPPSVPGPAPASPSPPPTAIPQTPPPSLGPSQGPSQGQAGGPGLALALPASPKAQRPDGGPEAPPKESAWLKASLASLVAKDLPGGGRLLLRRLPGRSLAACEICILGAGSLSAPGREGSLALGLALLSRGKEGSPAGELRRRIDAAGGRLELKEVSYDGLCLELVAPPADFPGLLDELLAALAKPAFASASFPAEEWDGAMRDFRVRAMRDFGDPGVQAAKAIRAEVYEGHPYAIPPLGSAQSLLGLTRVQVAEDWKAFVGSERIVISVAGDLDPELLLGLAGQRLASLGRRGVQPPLPPPLPVKDSLILLPRAGASGTYLRVDYSAPLVASPDYPALLVALSILQDLILEEVRGGDPHAYGVTSRLSTAAAASASIQVSRAKDGQRAKAAVERAVRLLASGACLSTSGSGLAPLKDSLEAYKLSTLSRTYSRAASAADLALRMARDLCAGGDGTAWFRLADRLAMVQAEDVQRVVRERLIEGPQAWAVAGPPALLTGFKSGP